MSNTLCAWTGLPLIVALTIESFYANIETYWFLGPVISLAAILGPWMLSWRTWIRWALGTIWSLGAAATMFAIADAAVTGGGPLHERDFIYAPFARDAMKIASGTTPLTDSYEIAASLTFYGARVVMIGSSPQTAQWQMWYGSNWPRRAIVFSGGAIAQRPETPALLRKRYGACKPGPTLRYRLAPGVNDEFSTKYCEEPVRPFAKPAAAAKPKA